VVERLMDLQHLQIPHHYDLQGYYYDLQLVITTTTIVVSPFKKGFEYHL
jgi:hypothetical protein